MLDRGSLKITFVVIKCNRSIFQKLILSGWYTKNKMISLIIPVFNEEKRLGASLEKLIVFLQNFKTEIEILIIDDASTDATLNVANSFKSRLKDLKVLHLAKNLGKGWAVKNGFFAASGDIVVFTDADFSTPIEEITKLLEKINSGFDIAIGSRALDRSLVKKHQNPLRETMGRIFNFFVQFLAIKGIADTQCGFKAFRKETTKELFEKQIIYDFGFDVELLFLARKKGLKIIEVPTFWYNDPSSNVNPIKDSILMFYDLIKIRLVHSVGKKSLFDKLLYQIYKKRTFVKFAIVGLSGTLVDYLSYFILTRIFNLPFLKANPIAVELAIIWNFTFNSLWTFSSRQKQKSFSAKFLTFQFVSLGGLMLSQIQILLYTHYLSVFDLFAKVLTIPVVAIFNYFINSRWTFRELSKEKSFTFVYLFLIIILFVLYLILVMRFAGNFILFIDK